MAASPDLSYTRSRSVLPSIQLTSWPLRDEPLKVLALAALVILAGLLSGYASGSGAMGLLISSILVVCSWTFWVPVKLELGPKGIIRSVLGQRRRMPWSEFSTYDVSESGVFLWPYTGKDSGNTIHGLYLATHAPAELQAVLDAYLRSTEADSPSLNETTIKQPGKNREGGAR